VSVSSGTSDVVAAARALWLNGIKVYSVIADQSCVPAPVVVGASAPYQCNAEGFLASSLGNVTDSSVAL
jgi:hypothetical protein